MNRQEKIDAIYKKIADKTLSFGCKIILENQEIIIAELNPGRVYEDYYEEKGIIEGRYVEHLGEYESRLKIDNIKFYNYDGTIENVDEEFLKDFIFNERDKGVIIGHPVMIGDVLDWIENNKNNGYEKCSECGTDINYREPEDLAFLKKMDLIIGSRFINNDNFLWKNLKAPIESQSDECVDFVYNLIS